MREPKVARILMEEFEALADWQIAVPHFTVMPNHWHALLVPSDGGDHSLSAIMKRLKGRTGKRVRAILGGRGSVWQGEWFDRWVRNDSEWDRIVDYVRSNPMKAGLCAKWSEHPWTR